MAVKCICEITVTDETDIDHLTTWYCRSTSPAKPAAPADGSTPASTWTTAEPGYDASLGTTYLYTVQQTVWGDGSLTYGSVQLSSSYEAAKVAWNKANTAQESIDGLEIGGRNLAIGTEPVKSFTKTKDASQVVAVYRPLSDYTDAVVAAGSKVTVSFEAKASEAPVIITPYLTVYTSSSNTTVSTGQHNETLTTDWQRFVQVLVVSEVPNSFQLTGNNYTGSSGVTYDVRRVKVETGTKSTDWSPAPEDVASDISSVQDNLNATRTWYATCPTAGGTAAKVATITPATTDFALVAGVTVAVKFDAANTVAAPTLNVNGTGDIDIKRYGTTAPSTSAATSWQAGSVATLTYDGTYWQLNNWLNDNTNYYDREQYKVALAASTAISAARIGVLGSDGKLKLLAAGGAFDITGPVLYVGTAYSADNVTAGTTKTSNYTFYGLAFNLTNTHAIAGAAAGKPVYIVGTLSGKIFTPNSTVLTCTIPASEDNLVYMRLGIMSTAANAVLESQHPLYMYFNGAFQQCDPATADAARTATNFISVDSTGIRIANADPATATTYQHQTADGTTFYTEDGNGDSAKRSEVNADGLFIYSGNSGSEVDVSHFTATESVIGKMSREDMSESEIVSSSIKMLVVDDVPCFVLSGEFNSLDHTQGAGAIYAKNFMRLRGGNTQEVVIGVPSGSISDGTPMRFYSAGGWYLYKRYRSDVDEDGNPIYSDESVAHIDKNGNLVASGAPTFKGIKLIYEAGETISGSVRCMGYVTASAKELRFTIPINKPIENAVTLNSMSIIPRANNSTLATITPTSSQVELGRGPSGINVTYNTGSAIPEMVNNSYYALQVSYSFVVQS